MELHEPNSGRLSFPTMFKRAQLPRQHLPGALPGQSRLAPEQCYAPADLRVGATLPVLGRQLFIYDCDDATRAWYTVRLATTYECRAPGVHRGLVGMASAESSAMLLLPPKWQGRRHAGQGPAHGPSWLAYSRPTAA